MTQLKDLKTITLPKPMVEIIKKLQVLRKAGQSDKEIEAVIHKMELPLGPHMALMGHYSEWMSKRWI